MVSYRKEERDVLHRILGCDVNWVCAVSNRYPGDSRITIAAKETTRLQKAVLRTPDYVLASHAQIWRRLEAVVVDLSIYAEIEGNVMLSIGFSSSQYADIADLLTHVAEEFKIQASSTMDASHFAFVFDEAAEADASELSPRRRRVRTRLDRHTLADELRI